MTIGLQGSGPDPVVRAAVIPAAGRRGIRAWWRTPTARRYAFGYTLLAPAALYVLLLVGAPFVFSLYLAMSDANAGDTSVRSKRTRKMWFWWTCCASCTRLPASSVWTRAGFIRKPTRSWTRFVTTTAFRLRPTFRRQTRWKR